MSCPGLKSSYQEKGLLFEMYLKITCILLKTVTQELTKTQWFGSSACLTENYDTTIADSAL